MAGVRLILALHNHQPVGNFDGVFASSFRDGYLPFLEVMEDYPAIPFALHTSGPLSWNGSSSTSPTTSAGSGRSSRPGGSRSSAAATSSQS